MKTLGQIRAFNALNASQVPGIGDGKRGGDTISGFPMLIKLDGLLATLAFSVEPNTKGELKNEGAAKIATELAKHLRSDGVAVARLPEVQGLDQRLRSVYYNLPTSDLENLALALRLVEELAGAESSQLRHATAEALAWLNYLKRFVA